MVKGYMAPVFAQSHLDGEIDRVTTAFFEFQWAACGNNFMGFCFRISFKVFLSLVGFDDEFRRHHGDQ
jgi:hypothetical protein